MRREPADESIPVHPTAPPPGVRHVLAVASGRGGVGTSSIAINIAVYLAQLGRTVLLVDANPIGGALHTLLNVSIPEPNPEQKLATADTFQILDTPVPGLRLLPQLYSVGDTVPVRPGRKPTWARKLRQQDVDYVLVDLGAGTARASLDLFLNADIGLLVAMPDPPSLEGAYRVMRALYQRRMMRTLLKDRFRLRLFERALHNLPPLPSPLDVVRQLARVDTAMAKSAALELQRFRPRLVVNGVRSRTETELGMAISDMAERYLGIGVDYIGHIERDDTVSLGVSRRQPLLIDSPTTKAARNIERIARRILALAGRKPEAPTTNIDLVASEPTLYDVLLTHRGASDEELRRAFKRQREIYAPGSLPLTSLVTGPELARAQALISEAHDTLLDPLRRRAYDLSTFPDAADEPKQRDTRREAALEAERALLREELASELSPQTNFTGPLLRKVRESLGVELADISARTKISVVYLSAIEDERFAELPAFVYLRGFVTEFAKFLKLDVTQVTRTYLRRYRAWKSNDLTVER